RQPATSARPPTTCLPEGSQCQRALLHGNCAHRHHPAPPRVRDNGAVHKPQLIATDVDGTLLGPDERLTARTCDALAGAVRDGVPVVLVSGRPPRWLAPVAQRAGLTGYAVCSNGAVLYDVGADEVLELRGLESEHLNAVAKTLATALPS